MYKTSWSVGLILIAALGLSRVEADPSSDPRGKQLECKTQYATSSDLRDPIVRIKMSLADGNQQIVHVAQSGRTFARADQYNFKSAAWADGQFTWKGTRLKSPNLIMIGQLKPMTDDKKWFSYTESLFDNKSGNKTYEMFSVCSITPDSTAAARLPPEDDKQVPSQQKAGVVSAAEAQADAKHEFEFRRLIVDTTGAAPEACFRFSRSLDGRPEAHYSDYLTMSPGPAPAVRVANTDVCVGGLAYGTTYKVSLAAGLPSLAGERTKRTETVEVSLGDKPPLISISGDGYIVPRLTSAGLSIQTVNMERLKVHVLRLSDKLLPSSRDALGGKIGEDARYWRAHALEDDGLPQRKLRDLLNNEAALIWSGTMDIAPDHNRTVQTAFPLASVITENRPGLYLVLAEDAAHALPESEFAPTSSGRSDERSYWLRGDATIPAHWVVVTDIALTALSGMDGLHVVVRSLKTADPIPGSRVTLLSIGQDELARAVTDETGQVAFAPGLLRGRGAAAASMIAAYGPAGDFAVLDLSKAAFDLSDRGVSGRQSAGPFEAFLYTDRGVYRPGETVEAMALLRNNGDALPDLPLTLVLRRPDGVEARRFVLEPTPHAGFHQSIALSSSSEFGMWSVEALLDPKGDAIGRAQFSVQDFVPQTLKVALTPSATVVDPNIPLILGVDAQFLYGAPAVGLHGEADISIIRDENPIASAGGYSFGVIDEKVEGKSQRIEIPTTDEHGHADVKLPVEPPNASTAPLKALISAGLFEPSGRAVKETIELPLKTQPFLIGLKPRFAQNRTEADGRAIVDVRVFDASGKGVGKPGLHWRLVRENRVYDWFEMNKSWRWHYHAVDEEIASGLLDVPADTPAAISQPVSWGQYRLVVDAPGTPVATSIRFVAGWTETTDAADTPDKVEVTADKASLRPGEVATLRIKGPFAGKAHIAVASDRVFKTRLIDVPREGTTFQVKAVPEWGAGSYVIVSMVRPLATGGPHDPVRAVGLAWIALAPHKLTVAISAPEKVAPRQRVRVAVQVVGSPSVGEDPLVTLAAVDEGILQLTHFMTPDPLGFFFGKRRLGIDIRDDYGRLLDGSADPGPIRQGGDQGSEAPIGGQPLAVTSTRTVALFSGPVQVGRDGKAFVDLDIPDFEGQVRLMAVAYDRHAMGSAEQTLIIRDPVVANLSLPRFLAPGDVAQLALSLHNTDGAAGVYHLRLSADGAAAFSSDHVLDYPLGPGERKFDSVVLRGIDAGVATIRAELSGPDGYDQHREWQIAVRAPHYPIAIEETARQGPGESVTLNSSKLLGLVPGSVTVSLGYTSYAGIDVVSLLQSLYRYPYGCTEQLTSIAFPLLYYDDPVLLGHAKKDEGVRQRVQSTIQILLDRQGASGKFGLWVANDGLASVWLNVYALDFLQHAREVGYDVPDASLQRSLNWLTQILPKLDEQDSGYYAESAPITRAYALYVIARAGRVDPAQLRYLHDTVTSEKSADGPYLPASIRWPSKEKGVFAPSISLGQLGAALTIMGDNVRARDSFEMALANIGYHSYPSWWSSSLYYSEVQDIAGLLQAAAEVGNKDVTQKALERLKVLAPSSEKLSTQEAARILSAIHALNKPNQVRSFIVNGKALVSRALPMAFSPTLAELNAGFTVTNAGSEDLWRTVVVRGAPTAAPSEMGMGFHLTRKYFTLDGAPLDISHLRQNDRFLVSLEGASVDRELRHTVLVDPLPAGWEIEGTVAEPKEAPAPSNFDISSAETLSARPYKFLGPLSSPGAIEARDDRFVAAFDIGHDPSETSYWWTETNKITLPENAFHLAYIVRVVTPGIFALPEAVVEDMYRPAVMARTAAGLTIIQRH